MITIYDEAGVGITLTSELIQELKFLRYFYSEASYYMGPSDMDIYDSIKEDFIEDNGPLPAEYALESEDDED